MTVDELLARITGEELGEWQYIFQKEEQIAQAVKQGIDPDVARSAAFESP